MKKLKLKAFDFEGSEILSREQLKKVMGGTTAFFTEQGTTDKCPDSFACNCDGEFAGCYPNTTDGICDCAVECGFRCV